MVGEVIGVGVAVGEVLVGEDGAGVEIRDWDTGNHSA